VKSRKINIMKTVPEFTDAEIQEMMDFKQVLALTESARSRSSNIVRGIIATVLITGLVGGALFVYETSSSSVSTDSTAPSQQPTSDVPPATVPTPIAPPDSMQAASPDGAEVARKKSTQKPVADENRKQTEEKKELTEENKSKESTQAMRVDSARSVSVFLPAEPVDGYPALYEYFAKELLYPEQAIKDSIQGVVLVTFVITAEGKPAQLATDHVLGEAFEKEAIRVIESMPAWKPAQLDGSPVRSKVSVPITFTIKTIKTPR